MIPIKGKVKELRGIYMSTRSDQASLRSLLDRVPWGRRVLLPEDAKDIPNDAEVSIITDTVDEHLIESVRQGAKVIIVATEPDTTRSIEALLGYSEFSHRQRSEWIVAPNHQLPFLARTPDEFAAHTALVTFTAPTEAHTLFTVNIALKNYTVASRQSLGRGTLTVLGIDVATLTQPGTWLDHCMGLMLATQHTATKHEFGVGVIGYGPYGGMGLYHGTAANRTPGLRIVSTMDANPERIAQAELDFPGIVGYTSVEHLLSDSATDIVVIATPPNTHFTLALQALEAGKHVVVEKPLCLTTDEADKLIDIAQGNHRVLTVHQNRRWDQDFRTLVALLDTNVIGEVFNIETSVSSFDHPCRAWHSDNDVSGGLAYDWGAHHIDWIHQLYGTAPERVYAFGQKRRWHEMTNLDQLRIHLQFPDGREATFFQSELDGFRRPKFYVQGTQGTIIGNYRPLEQHRVEPVFGYQVDRYHYAEAPVMLEVALYEGPGRLAHYQPSLVDPDPFGFHRNLADHLLVGTPLAVAPTDIRDVVAVLELAHRSTALGDIQALQPR